MCTPAIGAQVLAAAGAKEGYDIVQELRAGPPALPAPAAPPSPQSAAETSDEVNAALEAQRKAASRYTGQQASIMTSPLGLSTRAITQQKRLLGS